MKIFLLLAFFAFNSAALADSGTSVGNGGQSVICKNGAGEIISAETFDLFEGKILGGYQYKFEESIDPKELALKLAKKLDLSRGESSSHPGDIEVKTRIVIDAMIALPSGIGLTPTEDSREFVFPKNCDLVQTINFRQNFKIYYDSDTWAVLSNTNKAALYLHEAVYWHLRETGVETDSRRTRKIVSFLMSGGDLTKKKGIDPWHMQVQLCHSVAFNENRDWDTKLMVYKDLEDRLIVQFLQVGNYRILTKTYLMGEKDSSVPRINPIQKNIPELKKISGLINSPVDSEGIFSLTWGQGKIALKGSIQQGDDTHDELECVPWEIKW